MPPNVPPSEPIGPYPGKPASLGGYDPAFLRAWKPTPPSRQRTTSINSDIRAATARWARKRTEQLQQQQVQSQADQDVSSALAEQIDREEKAVQRNVEINLSLAEAGGVTGPIAKRSTDSIGLSDIKTFTDKLAKAGPALRLGVSALQKGTDFAAWVGKGIGAGGLRGARLVRNARPLEQKWDWFTDPKAAAQRWAEWSHAYKTGETSKEAFEEWERANLPAGVKPLVESLPYFIMPAASVAKVGVKGLGVRAKALGQTGRAQQIPLLKGLATGAGTGIEASAKALTPLVMIEEAPGKVLKATTSALAKRTGIPQRIVDRAKRAHLLRLDMDGDEWHKIFQQEVDRSLAGKPKGGMMWWGVKYTPTLDAMIELKRFREQGIPIPSGWARDDRNIWTPWAKESLNHKVVESAVMGRAKERGVLMKAAATGAKNVKEYMTRAKEKIGDELQRVHDLTDQVERDWVRHYGGSPMPDALRAGHKMQVYRGAAQEGKNRANTVQRDVKKILGSLDPRNLDLYMYLRRELELLGYFPTRTIPRLVGHAFTPGQTMEALRKNLRDMADHLGAQDMAAIKLAASKITGAHHDLLRRKIEANVVDAALGERLIKKYHNYNPTQYQRHLSDQMAVKDVRRAKQAAREYDPDALAKLDDGIDPLSREGVDAEVMGALSMLEDSLVTGEMIIAQNQAMHSLYRTAFKRNPDMVRKLTASEAQRKGVAEGKGLVPFFDENAKLAYLELDEKLAEAVARGFRTNISGVGSVARSINAVPRAVMTTAHTPFMVGNFFLDMFTVMYMHGVSPLETVGALWKQLIVMFRDDPVIGAVNSRLAKATPQKIRNYFRDIGEEAYEGYDEMVRKGGGVGGYYGPTGETILKQARRTKNVPILNDTQSINAWFKELADNPIGLQQKLLGRSMDVGRSAVGAVPKVGRAAETAPRRAVYEKFKREGYTELQAIKAARDTTIDFARAGSAIRTLNDYILFLNPAVQGAFLPFRAAGRAKDYPMFWYSTSAMFTAQVALYKWNSQFPEYQDMSPWLKWGRFPFMLPSDERDQHGNVVPRVVTLIPATREQAWFSIIPYVLGKLHGTNPDGVADLLKVVAPAVSPMSLMGITPSDEQALPLEMALPAPYLFKQVMDWQRNYDSFRQQPIVPPEMANERPEAQFDAYTSEPAKHVGSWLGLSPKKLDFFMRVGALQDVIIGADWTLKMWQDGIDPSIEEHATTIEDAAEILPPAALRDLKSDIFSDLEPDDRTMLRERLNAPPQRIPIVDGIKNRFYRMGGGGSLYKTVRRKVLGDYGLTEQDIREVAGIVRAATPEVEAAARDAEKAFETGEIDGRTWREVDREIYDTYRAVALATKVLYPPVESYFTDSNVRSRVHEEIHETMKQFREPADRYQYLYVGWSALPVPKEDAPGEPVDWDRYYQYREEFEKNLSEGDLQGLREEIENRYSKTKLAFVQGRHAYQSYFGIKRDLAAKMAAAAEPGVEQWDVLDGYDRYKEREEIKVAENVSSDEWARFRADNALWVNFEDRIQMAQRTMRMQNEKLDTFLVRYGYKDKVVHPDLDPAAAGLSQEEIARRQYHIKNAIAPSLAYQERQQGIDLMNAPVPGW